MSAPNDLWLRWLRSLAFAGEPGSGGGMMQAVRALELQLSLLMKQEQQMAAGG